MNMNDNLAREILMSHADTLATGHDVTEKLATRYPELAPLLRMARDIDSVLAVVPVSAEFKYSLKTSLLQRHAATPTFNSIPATGQAEERSGWAIGGAVALGSAMTGLAVYSLRRFMTDDAPVPTPRQSVA